jgi:hypothetical protein
MAESLTYRAYQAFTADDLARLQNEYRLQEQAMQQQIAQATAKAQQDARAYFDADLANRTNQILQRNSPEINKYQSVISQIERFRRGDTNKITIPSPFGGNEVWERQNFGPGSEWVYDEYINQFRREIDKLGNPQVLRQQALGEIADSSQFGQFGGISNLSYQLSGSIVPDEQTYARIEQMLRDDAYQTAYPQAEAYYVQPLLGRLESITSDFNKNYENIYQSGERRAEQAVDQWYNYVDSRKAETDRQVQDLRNSGEYTPEKEQAIRNAYQSELSFLRGPEFNFAPDAYNRARSVFDQSYTQNVQNIPAPPPPPPVETPAPTVTAPAPSPAPSPAPVAAPAPTPVATPEVSQGLIAPTQPAAVTPPLAEVAQPVQAPLVTTPPQPTVTTPPVTTQPTPVATQPTPIATQPTPVAQPVQPSPSFLGGIPVGVASQPIQTGNLPMATALSSENLPPLRSAGGGGTSAIDPTLRPYLELGLRAAEQQFLQNVPQFFPGQTYVSPSQQTLDALAAQEQIARQAPATLQAAQESYMRGLGGLGATASGAFLAGNPFQQQMIQAATRPIMQQFEEQTLPGIASGFSGAGRYGSGAMERALGRATESTARAIGDVSTNIAFQDYGAERGRQQQAILGQITAAGQAPQIYGQQFLPSQQLAQIGAAREAIAGLPLQEQMQRFQFAQQAPRESLSAFLSSVYGTPMASSQYAPQQQAQTNRVGSTLGGAATGAGIGYMIGGATGAGYGAALGTLGGLLL